MSNEKQSGSRFIVDLGDVKLPYVLEKQIEAEIQAVVLKALAQSDAGRSQQSRLSPTSIWDQFPGGTMGLWLGDLTRPPIFFPGGGGGGGFPPLTPRDHTLIMREVMEHPLEIIRELPAAYKSKVGPRPTGEEVLKAALQVEEIDNYAKERMRLVLKDLPRIEEGIAALPESTKRSLEELRGRMSNQPMAEKRRALRDPNMRARHRDDGLAEGMEIAAQMLEDGQDSIYSPDHSFYRMFSRRGGPSGITAKNKVGVGDVADTDGVGGAGGGAVGLIVGGPVGGGVGAIVGGASASAGFAIAWALDSIFDIF